MMQSMRSPGSVVRTEREDPLHKDKRGGGGGGGGGRIRMGQ